MTMLICMYRIDIFDIFCILMTTPQPKKVDPLTQMHPSAATVTYLSGKCPLPLDQIEKKLTNGEMFDMIKGEGADIDTKLMEEILNEYDYYEKPTQKILKDQAMKFICDIVEQWSI